MFSFDVHDDVRLIHDASVEKDEVRSSSLLSLPFSLSPFSVLNLKKADDVLETDPRRQSRRTELVQSFQAYLPRLEVGGVQPRGQ